MLKLVEKNRSYRRFYQDAAVEREALEKLVNLARLSASAGNKQPLKYILSCETKKNELVFQNLAWAAYLEDWEGPAEGERPAGYIVVLHDKTVSSQVAAIDVGIACQSILLGAVARGLGGCILVSIKRERLREALGIPEQFEIPAVIALGKPKETVVVEPFAGDIKYWRDAEGVHHVPKRSLEGVILKI